ncbi:CBM9 family sugar-binding protein [Psychroserpens luteolus]|uniref:CBM9 family sugar-binding protein n=1 Tax=Psychroserpens luteolus TaxID=2855840 RepID=UPI001E3EFDEA|nr:CBM9 family sugar-binding protein [Psychroserpens luteolus]
MKPEHQLLNIKKSKTNIVLDGKADENAWENANWYPIDQLWLGSSYSENDFSGRYKLTWTNEALYLLAEITDDVLLDKEPDPLKAWWDDDCLEIFIDENNSGGDHQFTHNAFAYHIALDGNVVDMSTSEKGKLYNSHIESKRETKGDISIWEVKILLYDDTYTDDGVHTSITLKPNKKVGFALAYCDNDTSANRENFIGSIAVEGDDKNRGWIDADIFGTLLLTK